MKPSYRIVFYVSGHGFGHASRSLEVIRALNRMRPDVGITVKTAAAPRLFAAAPIQYIEFQADTGMVQLDSLHLDVGASIRNAAAFHAALAYKAQTEARALTESGIQLVVGDIPPLAFAAAGIAGLPSVGLGNFTWDWIYAGYPDTPAELLQVIRDAYAAASVMLRLPMSAGFDGDPSKLRDIPFIARTSHRDPAEVRSALGLPNDKPMVLTSFGAYGLRDLNMAELGRLSGYTVVTEEFPASGFAYQDLVRAADVVVTKPGYGIISECIANDTAVLYTSRGEFPEYDVLVREMPKYLRSQFISQDDLLAGRWKQPLNRLLELPPAPMKPSVNGADVAASIILNELNG
jgi:UDP:flavonoid glycosyltransferase YjiC (YdhE family)